MKKAIAIGLTFVMLGSLAACRKLDQGKFDIESYSYVVDNDGVTHQIADQTTPKGERYYTNADGDQVVVKDDEIASATRKVSVDETTLNQVLKDLMDGKDVTIPQESSSAATTIPYTVADDQIQKDDKQDVNKYTQLLNGYQQILNSSEYTFGFSTYSMDSNQSTTESIPAKITHKNDMTAYQVWAPIGDNGTMETRMFFGENAAYMILPMMKSYISVPKSVLDSATLVEIPDDMFDLQDDVKPVIGTVTLNGVDYEVLSYTSKDNASNKSHTIRYYFENDNLKRIEKKDDEALVMIAVNELSTKSDASLLSVPEGYQDISNNPEIAGLLEGMLSENTGMN